MKQFENYVNGRWAAASGPFIEVDDPSTGEIIGSVPDSGADVVDQAVGAARAAFEGPWARMRPQDRAQVLRDLASALDSRFDELSDELVRDTGCTARLCGML
ncbi:Aldehyde dehydrogenase [Pseudonocardia sp. Ae406_Ps2]|nr:Aldehyde dehydrogenase [Pseudonocardia sp. Ae331_Ps2]OLM05369.1 Aldehyde dehydrogenase [Pseudonocardia sp. Ae406_Ps2]OLM15680.1 Aldehyde dehydrogenase [Pseudonocardia sp. Ae505_Ps2]OLM26940.1 Aldehyde dehydrogenase [Pseudonocardia sp. Ae706_Ps2]